MDDDIKFIASPIPLEKLIRKAEIIDYDKIFTYFPISEILEEDVPFIYDYKMKGTKDEISSLPLSRAFKYESYRRKKDELENGNSPILWYS